jgi:hypothetical protein
MIDENMRRNMQTADFDKVKDDMRKEIEGRFIARIAPLAGIVRIPPLIKKVINWFAARAVGKQEEFRWETEYTT